MKILISSVNCILCLGEPVRSTHVTYRFGLNNPYLNNSLLNNFFRMRKERRKSHGATVVLGTLGVPCLTPIFNLSCGQNKRFETRLGSFFWLKLVFSKITTSIERKSDLKPGTYDYFGRVKSLHRKTYFRSLSGTCPYVEPLSLNFC